MSDTSLVRDARFAYPLALALVITPTLELAARLYPLKPYLVQWRFQAEIGLVSAAPVLLLGFLVAIVAGRLSEAPGVLKLLGVLCAVYGVLLMPALAMLMLDSGQIQQMAAANARESIRDNTFVTAIKGATYVLATFGLAVGAWRSASVVAARIAGSTPGAGRSANRNSPDDSDLILVSGAGE
jgi:hypothetical protein